MPSLKEGNKRGRTAFAPVRWISTPFSFFFFVSRLSICLLLPTPFAQDAALTLHPRYNALAYVTYKPVISPGSFLTWMPRDGRTHAPSPWHAYLREQKRCLERLGWSFRPTLRKNLPPVSWITFCSLILFGTGGTWVQGGSLRHRAVLRLLGPSDLRD